MRQKVINHGGLTKGLLGPLAAEKKKAVAASCLIAVMAIMWVRVLTKQTPEAAEAALMTEQLSEEGSFNQELNVLFIELRRLQVVTMLSPGISLHRMTGGTLIVKKGET